MAQAVKQQMPCLSIFHVLFAYEFFIFCCLNSEQHFKNVVEPLQKFRSGSSNDSLLNEFFKYQCFISTWKPSNGLQTAYSAANLQLLLWKNGLNEINKQFLLKSYLKSTRRHINWS